MQNLTVDELALIIGKLQIELLLKDKTIQALQKELEETKKVKDFPVPIEKEG